ncbi:hypothetical protein GCM10027590_39580 [Nocardiopsis nanhaiensis]
MREALDGDDLERAAETATIKRQETGNHPHKTSTPTGKPHPQSTHPANPNPATSPSRAQRPPALRSRACRVAAHHYAIAVSLAGKLSGP